MGKVRRFEGRKFTKNGIIMQFKQKTDFMRNLAHFKRVITINVLRGCVKYIYKDQLPIKQKGDFYADFVHVFL